MLAKPESGGESREAGRSIAGEANADSAGMPGNIKSPSWWLFTFTDAVCRSSKPAEVYHAALAAIQGAIGCDRAAICLLDDDGEPDLIVLPEISAAFRAALGRWSAKSAEATYLENVAGSEIPEALKISAAIEGVQSLSFIPVMAQGAVKGQLVLGFIRPHRLDQSQQVFALAIARQLGFSLERMAAEATRSRAEERLLYLAAMVESSDDAIITKDLDGIITSWNSGAERIFGYSANETIGKPITIIIPEERHEEERMILASLRRGQRIEHFETVRRSRDGQLIDISLTVSPVKDFFGNVVGASKIARDISERRRAEEQIELQLREMHHRVRNLFALASSIVTMSAGRATTVQQLAATACRRLQALATAQSLTMRPLAIERNSTSLRALLEAVLKPFRTSLDESDASISIHGCDTE
ncbi:MAG: PAS domain S-box protein, partial [Alphaproteobacteria bacterium]|nr:PAS domain S-box protein [Alphaproteobacteria bacterium]